jgi:hypothetical protein
LVEKTLTTGVTSHCEGQARVAFPKQVVLHKPSLKKKELRGLIDGLAELEVQSILSGAFCPSLLHDDLSMLCNILVGDLEYVFVMLERSPHTYSCTYFI